jgi:hypothetical protein
MAVEYKYFVVNFIAKASLIIIAVLRVLVVVLHSTGLGILRSKLASQLNFMKIVLINLNLSPGYFIAT